MTEGKRRRKFTVQRRDHRSRGGSGSWKGKELSPLGDLQLSTTLLEGGRTAAIVMHSNSEHSKIDRDTATATRRRDEGWC